VVYVDAARCSGCGLCVDACHTGAMRLQDGVATIDQSRCVQCESCVNVCPELAILSVSEPAEERLPATVAGREVDAIEIAPPAVAARRPASQPAIGAALAFVGREIVPRALDWLLDRWDRRDSSEVRSAGSGANQALASPPAMRSDGPAVRGNAGTAGGGRQRRRRHRGGR